MKKEDLLPAIQAVKKESKKRKFKQSFDLIINLKSFDVKKQPIDSFLVLPRQRGKKLKICGLVDKDLVVQAKETFDRIITKDDFDKLKGNIKELKKIADQYDFFVAQANIMPQIATVFGRVFGPRGKMPNPKSGAIIPPKMSTLKPVYEKLQNTIRIITKNEPIIKCPVGNEESKDEDIASNVMSVYSNLVGLLPQEENNIASVVLKLTMGKPFRIGAGNK